MRREECCSGECRVNWAVDVKRCIVASVMNFGESSSSSSSSSGKSGSRGGGGGAGGPSRGVGNSKVNVDRVRLMRGRAGIER